ncbi:MAG: type II secretion system F family protein [Xanthobacteraceae bacterium]
MDSLWGIYLAIFAAVVLAVQAIYLVFFRLRTQKKAINRRLALGSELTSSANVLETLRRERGFTNVSSPVLQRINDWLTQTGLSINRTALVFAAVALFVFLFLIIGLIFRYGPLSFVASLCLALFVVYFYLAIARSRRIARIGEQLPDALDIIVRGVRVGHPFPMALNLVAREMPDPIGTEFGMTGDEISFGLAIKTAIDNLYRRTGHEDLLFFVIAISIQSQTGGNLGEVLHRLSRMIRARAKLRLKVRALSAEGRMSAYALTIFPFVLFGIISLVSPEYFGSVRHHPLIMPAAVVGLFMLGLANIIMYRMVNAKS